MLGGFFASSKMVVCIKSDRHIERGRESGAIATAYNQETALAMHENTVFDADLQNKRLQVSGLFGGGARQMRAVEHSAANAKAATLPIQTLTLEVSNHRPFGDTHYLQTHPYQTLEYLNE